MSKIEKQIKKYYLDSFKHASQLNNIKSRANFEEKHTFNFSKLFKFGVGLSVGFASICGALIIVNSLNASNGYIAPMTQRIEKAVVQINNGPSVSFTVNEKGIVDAVYGNDNDGKLLIYGLDLLNKPYEDVVQSIIDEEISCGYLLKDDKNKKFNNLSFIIYDDNSNIDENEFARSINDYLIKKSVSLNDDVEVEVEEEYESIYPFDGTSFGSFNEFYEELKNYYIEQGNAVSDIVEEFDVLMHYYSTRLAYYETLFEDDDDAKIKEMINVLSVRINNYLKGFYDLFVGENSSYQELYKSLLNEKANLLINRVDESFDYDAEVLKVDKKILSLETLKEFFMEDGLKPKLNKLNEGLNTILEYVGNNEQEEVDEKSLSKKIEEKQRAYNALFDKTALIEDLLKIKKDLKSHFR